VNPGRPGFRAASGRDERYPRRMRG
jgi:hypothetical protein